MLYFLIQQKMVLVSSKSDLICKAGHALTVARSDHTRVGPALGVTLHQFFDIEDENL